MAYTRVEAVARNPKSRPKRAVPILRDRTGEAVGASGSQRAVRCHRDEQTRGCCSVLPRPIGFGADDIVSQSPTVSQEWTDRVAQRLAAERERSFKAGHSENAARAANVSARFDEAVVGKTQPVGGANLASRPVGGLPETSAARSVRLKRSAPGRSRRQAIQFRSPSYYLPPLTTSARTAAATVASSGGARRAV